MAIETQLGGKFSSKDMGLFHLKSHLRESGITVQYPEGDGIVAVRNGIELTFDPDKVSKSFYEVELIYLDRVRQNPVHIVHNKFIDHIGYVGESASVEVAFAMTHSKPIVLLYPSQLGESVPPSIKDILIKRSDQFHVARLDQLPQQDVVGYLQNVIDQGIINYGLSVSEEIEVYRQLDALLAKYQQMK